MAKEHNFTSVAGLKAFLRPTWAMSPAFHSQAEAQALSALLIQLVRTGHSPSRRYIHIHVNDAGDRWSILSSREEPRCNCGGLVL